jgi:hypothetical protein
MKNILCAALVAVVLTGCVGYKAVEAMKAVKVGDDITVDPQIQWANAVNIPGVSGIVWTVDGFGLDELRFYTGIADKAPLMAIPGIARKDMGVYNTTMLPDDVMELISSTLGKAGNQQLHTENLRPTPFGRLTGFRFDLAFTTMDGLQMKGEALFAQRRKKLDVLLYVAPAEFYYDRYADTVERIFSSVKVPDAPPAMARAD